MLEPEVLEPEVLELEVLELEVLELEVLEPVELEPEPEPEPTRQILGDTTTCSDAKQPLAMVQAPPLTFTAQAAENNSGRIKTSSCLDVFISTPHILF